MQILSFKIGNLIMGKFLKEHFFLYSLIFLMLPYNFIGQSVSASTQNSLNKLSNEYYPRLEKMKNEIESNKTTISSAKCNNYILELNKTIGIWNDISKSDLNNKKVKQIGKELDVYIEYATVAQELYKVRQKEESQNANNNKQINNSNKTQNTATNDTPSTSQTNVQSNKKFKVGDKVSIYQSSNWTWGIITGIEGQDYKEGNIAYQDYEVDIKLGINYLPEGKQKVGEKQTFEYWPYHTFFEQIKAMRNSELSQIFRMIYEYVGKNAGSNYGVFAANGQNITTLQKEIKIVEDILVKLPSIPEDAKRYSDRSAIDMNVTAYKLVIDGKNDFFDSKIKQMFDEYLKVLKQGKTSPVGITSNKQLKYIDNDQKTIFWIDLVCENNSEKIKNAVIKDLNGFLKEMNLTQNAAKFLTDWDEMIEDKRKFFDDKANEDKKWSTVYPHSDAKALSLYKRDLGGTPKKILFQTNQYRLSGGIGDKNKIKTGVAFFEKEGDCPYYFYVEFSMNEKHKGNGAYEAPKCYYIRSGYTNSIP